jgi:hypothetical protein
MTLQGRDRWAGGLVGMMLLVSTGCFQTKQPCDPNDLSVEPEVNDVSEPNEMASVIADQALPDTAPVLPSKSAQVKLILDYQPGQTATYRYTWEQTRSAHWEGITKVQPELFKPRTTGQVSEMVFTEQVKTVDDYGNATVDITLTQLNTTVYASNTTEYDSTQDPNGPSAFDDLIGKTYTVLKTPRGRVHGILNSGTAKSALDRDKPHYPLAQQLLSDDMITHRHSFDALMSNKEPMAIVGQQWSKAQTLSFNQMGVRTFDKLYTYRGLHSDQAQVALVRMNGVPSVANARELHQTQDPSPFSQMFDEDFQYEGQLELDLSTGALKQYSETLEIHWAYVDPRSTDPNATPTSMHMSAKQAFSHELLSLEQTAPKKPAPPGCRLALRFDPNRPLTYEFVSSRDIEVQWEPNAANQAKAKNSKMAESLTLVMTVQPIEVNDLSMRVKATCVSAVVRRTKLDGSPTGKRDAVEGLVGKSFHLGVDTRGTITEYTELDALLKETGEMAFFEHSEKGRTKSPEMIADVWATQWFLWDAISMSDPNRIRVGDTWSSQLSLPTPMVMRKARGVEYTLGAIEETDQGRIAVIDSQFTLSADTAPRSWPIPYSGTFHVSGPFGLLRGYKILSLSGSGRETFNIDQGRSLGYEHHYRVEMSSMMPPMIWTSIKIVIDQTISMTPKS